MKFFTLAATGLAIASPLANPAPVVPEMETAVATVQKRVSFSCVYSSLSEQKTVWSSLVFV